MSTTHNQGKWLTWLASVRLFWMLIGLNLLVTVAVVIATIHTVSPDQHAYLGYAEGLTHGRYSYWYFLPEYVPDTFRNPGYPLFLFPLRGLGISEFGIRLLQVGLYLITIALVIRLAARCESSHSWLVRNLFLLLLLPNIQLAYFAAVIYPEILVAFLTAAYGVVALTWPQISWKRTLVLALLAGLIFQTRPIFIFFPLLQVGLDFWRARRKMIFSWLQGLAFLGLFGVTMLPYSLWNYHHHGVFKPTSLEGGAGVMQIGFWALRMPGYQEHHYWGNTMGEEIISFVDPKDIPAHIASFNREWDVIDAQCRLLLTARDRRYLPLMRRRTDNVFPTYSSAYTLRREQLMMKANLADIRREPGYYFKTRLYTLVRLWVTGVQSPAWRAAITPLAKLKVLYPTLVSGATFLLALLSFGWILLFKRSLINSAALQLALALVVYFGLVHLPFAIQARYTVPVRPWLLFGTAIAIAAWLTRRSSIPVSTAAS